MKVLHGVIVDDLRLKRWGDMLGKTFRLAVQHSDEPQTWLAQELSLTLQRLLKGIQVDKAVY